MSDQFKVSVIATVFSTMSLKGSGEELITGTLELSNFILHMEKSVITELGEELIKFRNAAINNEIDFTISNICDIFDKYHFPRWVVVLENGSLVWQQQVAPYIWIWIHTVCPKIDIFYGSEMKRIFVDFVYTLIQCGICRTHYLKHRDFLFQALDKTSLYRVFLALHTFIQMGIEGPFLYKPELVLAEYEAFFNTGNGNQGNS